MKVTREMKAKVEAKLQECLDIVNAKYTHHFTMPTVKYTKRGRVAGTACDRDYEINLNAVLLMENGDTFINRTVVHEFGHLVDGIINPETRETTIKMTRSGKLKRTKRDVHGPTWKRIMRLLGGPTTRCHSYDTTNSRVKKAGQAKHVWKCKCGRSEMKIGAIRHKKQLNAHGHHFWMSGHKRCGGYTYVGVEGQELKPMLLAAEAPAPAPKVPTRKPAAAPGASKLDKCRRVYDPDLTRDQNIVAFQEEGCTPAGAATYYAKIKKEFGA